MNEATNRGILDNWINGNKKDAKKMFARLDKFETIEFFTFLHIVGYDDPVRLIDELSQHQQ